jgi:hypothetical protein
VGGAITQSAGTTTLKDTTVDNLTVAVDASIAGALYFGLRKPNLYMKGTSGDLTGKTFIEVQFYGSQGYANINKIELFFYKVRHQYSGTVSPTPGLRIRLCTTVSTPISTGYLCYPANANGFWVGGGNTYIQLTGMVTLTPGVLGSNTTWQCTSSMLSYDTNGGSTLSLFANGYLVVTSPVVSVYVDNSYASAIWANSGGGSFDYRIHYN